MIVTNFPYTSAIIVQRYTFFVDLVIWGFGDLLIGDLLIWWFGDLLIWGFGDLGIWGFGDLSPLWKINFLL